MVSVRNDSIVNYYMIEEFYRIRQGSDRFYLLSFDRSMKDIFLAEKESLVNNKIVLGIQNGEINMTESDERNESEEEGGEEEDDDDKEDVQDEEGENEEKEDK